MPTIKNPVVITVNGVALLFQRRVFEDLPDARGFLSHLLERASISTPVAVQYVKLAARLARQGRLLNPELIVHNVERTAANAYLRWAVDNYTTRTVKIDRALSRYGLGTRARYIRRHALVQPYSGKMIPVRGMPPIHPVGYLAARFAVPDPMAPPRAPSQTPVQEEIPLTMEPAFESWTLHVPRKLCEPHVDPCRDCTAIVLDNAQLNVIAEVVEKVWGHRDLNAIPPEAYLFGPPPPDVDIGPGKEKPERIVAFVGHGVTRDELIRLKARATTELASFTERLGEGVEGVYLSRAMCGERLGDVLGVLWKAWGTA